MALLISVKRMRARTERGTFRGGAVSRSQEIVFRPIGIYVVLPEEKQTRPPERPIP
jgi:hypothetical protein